MAVLNMLTKLSKNKPMCKFFSFVTDGKNNPFFFNDEKRSELIKSNPENYVFDSHSSICKFFNLKEDSSNKYEYNPLTGEFTVDQVNNKSDDRIRVEKWVRKLDFKTVVKELVIKPIVHPFQIEPPEINDTHIKLLKEWASVGDSVRDSVRDSVWDSVRAYDSSFFVLNGWKHPKAKNGKNPFQPCIDLWEQGIVPSFDKTTWRLHTKNGIVWEGKL